MTNPSSRRSGRPSTSPTGTQRAGRRQTQRPRQGRAGFLERWRTPLVAIVAIAIVGVVGAVVVGSASAASYSCTTIDTVKPAPSGEIGQVQKDLGNAHIDRGVAVTYAVCPPASGKHVNRVGFGPLEPRVYGPDDRSEPQGWIHNLEHGGLVLLYSCDKGACEDATFAKLREFSTGFPKSAVCGLSAGTVGPVIARFEQMPTRFAALLWNRVLYLDELDPQQVYDFFLKYAERVAPDGTWISPPEEQCPAPSPSASPGGSPSASPSAAPSPSGAGESPAGSPAASPSAVPSPSAS